MPRGRIVLEMPPLHGRSEYRAEHIVDVIDGLGRVSHFREVGDTPLDLLSRDL